MIRTSKNSDSVGQKLNSAINNIEINSRQLGQRVWGKFLTLSEEKLTRRYVMELKTILAAPASLFERAVSLIRRNQVKEQEVNAICLCQTSKTHGGQQIQYPQTDSPEITSFLVEMKPGAQTGWHQHPVPGCGYILEGTLTVETENGHQSEFKAGEVCVELIDTYHNCRNLGRTPVKLLAFFIGEQCTSNILPRPSSNEMLDNQTALLHETRKGTLAVGTGTTAVGKVRG